MAALLVTTKLKDQVIQQAIFEDRDRILIGRGAENDILLDNAGVSRQHAQVVYEDEEYSVLDMQSANGTWLNGEEVDCATLKSGDVIQVGKYSLHIGIDDPSSLRANPGAESWREDMTIRAPQPALKRDRA